MSKVIKVMHPFLGVLAALYGIYLLYGIGNSMMDRYTVGQLTEQMKTACVCRFLIDLPATHPYFSESLPGVLIDRKLNPDDPENAEPEHLKSELVKSPALLGQTVWVRTLAEHECDLRSEPHIDSFFCRGGRYLQYVLFGMRSNGAASSHILTASRLWMHRGQLERSPAST